MDKKELLQAYKDAVQELGEEMISQEELRYLQSRVRGSKRWAVILPLIGTSIMIGAGIMVYLLVQQVRTGGIPLISEDSANFAFVAAVLFLFGFLAVAGGIQQKKTLLADIQQPMKERLRAKLLKKQIEKDGDHELLFAVANIGDIDVSPRIYNMVEEGSWWIVERAKKSNRNFRMYRESDNFILFDWVQDISPKR